MADIVQSCGLERATGAVDAALQCIIQMAASPGLQVHHIPLPPHLCLVFAVPSGMTLGTSGAILWH